VIFGSYRVCLQQIDIENLLKFSFVTRLRD
jgi:hypothetical protein